MADLFVSYSREDKARAEDVVRLLEDYGWDVFWDQETRSGTHWPKVLEEELIKARCLVALWTTTSIASRWVRIEAYEALQNEKLVPVLLDKVRPPLEFRQTQTFDLIGWNGDRQDRATSASASRSDGTCESARFEGRDVASNQARCSTYVAAGETCDAGRTAAA